jgi:hypothetical protein
MNRVTWLIYTVTPLALAEHVTPPRIRELVCKVHESVYNLTSRGYKLKSPTLETIGNQIRYEFEQVICYAGKGLEQIFRRPDEITRATHPLRPATT